MTTGLSVSRLINVEVNLTPQLASFPNISTCLLLGTSTVINTVTRMRTYANLAEVAEQFGTSAPEYLAAQKWFTQVPAPRSLQIGRWVKTAAAGQLIGGVLSATNQLLSTWTAINNGSFKITIDGGAEQDIIGLNFSAALSLAGVAAILDTAIVGATVAYDSVFKQFIVTSATTGATSTVSFATAGSAGTDISNMLNWRSTSTGVIQAPGLAAQTALATVELFDNMFSSQWYGLVIPDAVDADHVAVAGYIEAAIDPPHFYGINTQSSLLLSTGDTTNIAAVLKAAGYGRSTVQYSSTSPYAIMSLLARILTTNWEANNSTITLMYKQEPTVTPENLTNSQAAAVASYNANVFVTYNNDTAIIQYGTVANGEYIDSVIGCDWLRGAITTNIYNALYGAKKIPQTDAGNHQLYTQIAAACSQGVTNGLLAPGVWQSQGVGQIVEGDYLPLGYYIYQPPIASQPAPDRADRKSVVFEVLAKLAGAVHTAEVQVSVNQ